MAAASESTARFFDVECGSGRRLPPIKGFEDKPVIPLTEAVKSLESLVPEVQHMVYIVQGNCNNPKDGLTPDESASIMLYTLEWFPPETSFYYVLNAVLRSADRRQLLPWFSYLRLVIQALSKLPLSHPKVIYRGVQLNLNIQYQEGDEIIWWPFSSCTANVGLLKTHAGEIGNRTIFNIFCRSAIDISRHSCFHTEKEYLLYPGRQFKVLSVLNAGGGLHIIEIEETEPLFPHFRVPLVEKPNPRPSLTDQSINILFIGEKGVGKSTLINAFANYLKFKTMEEAQANPSIVLKPLSFAVTINDNLETRTITFGNFDHRDSSITDRCQTYTFNLNNGKKICLIDTPSLEDEHDYNRYHSNPIRHILEYVNNLTHLNAVCFILKPEASQLLNSFQSCFSQLMNHLGRNARRNVIFCFTNILMAFSNPGSTAPLLRRLFESCSMNDIPFSKTNTFSFDNESFRYLIAVQNRIRFTNDEHAEYAMSWPESVIESNRLLNYVVTQLTPFNTSKF